MGRQGPPPQFQHNSMFTRHIFGTTLYGTAKYGMVRLQIIWDWVAAVVPEINPSRHFNTMETSYYMYGCSYRNLPQSSGCMVLVVSERILSLVVFKRRILTMPYRTVPCWHGKIVSCKRSISESTRRFDSVNLVAPLDRKMFFQDKLTFPKRITSV